MSRAAVAAQVPTPAFSADYRALLDLIGGSANTQPLTLTLSGLTVGASYEFHGGG